MFEVMLDHNAIRLWQVLFWLVPSLRSRSHLKPPIPNSRLIQFQTLSHSSSSPFLVLSLVCYCVAVAIIVIVLTAVSCFRHSFIPFIPNLKQYLVIQTTNKGNSPIPSPSIVSLLSAYCLEKHHLSNNHIHCLWDILFGHWKNCAHTDLPTVIYLRYYFRHVVDLTLRTLSRTGCSKTSSPSLIFILYASTFLF
ncbi:hypothetical protein SNK04_009997 [Fusarium graminearum]